MRRGCSIYVGVLLCACTAHEEALHVPELAPVQEVGIAPTIPDEPSGPAPESVVEPESTPFPNVYCTYPDEQAKRWRVHIDPTDDAHQRRAERLARHYPDADGAEGALARSNLPEPWRDLDAVTLIRTRSVEATSVRTAGVYSSPSGAAFTFVLRARASEGPGVVIEGQPSPMPDVLRPIPTASVDAQRWATVGQSVRDLARRGLDQGNRPGILARHVRWIEADLGGGIEGLMVHAARRRPGELPSFSVIAASDGSADAVPVPIFEGGTTTGAPGVTDEAYYEPIALSDLDRDGHDELLIRENWYEGSYEWLVRYDRDEGVVATLLCGDAL